MNPPFITLGRGEYSVAAATGPDGQAHVTFRKLQVAEVPGALLPPRTEKVADCDLILAVTNREAAEVLLCVAVQIASRFGVESVESKLTADLIATQKRLTEARGELAAAELRVEVQRGNAIEAGRLWTAEKARADRLTDELAYAAGTRGGGA